ncbi:MAG: hypothetical protein HQL40_13290 [Alphaproteobacteria bacterium]|nr:hypothetical protein [Alphaproteobacteria bacterium]
MVVAGTATAGAPTGETTQWKRIPEQMADLVAAGWELKAVTFDRQPDRPTSGGFTRQYFLQRDRRLVICTEASAFDIIGKEASRRQYFHCNELVQPQPHE